MSKYQPSVEEVESSLAIGLCSDGRLDIDCHVTQDGQFSKLLAEHAHLRHPLPVIQNHQVVPKLDIVIQVAGSRGDVQPFIALGSELQHYHGHRVRIATHANFESFVRDSGLEFYPIGGDPTELMAYIVKNPGLIPSIASIKAGDIGRKRQMLAEMLDGCWKSCIEQDTVSGRPFVADAIIANPPSFGHVHCAQALGIPLHIMFTMPWTSTRAFAHPLANLRCSFDTNRNMANLISYHVVEWMIWQGTGDVINNWRTRTLGLEALPSSEGPRLLKTLHIPHTYCWSPALVPRPSDWPGNIDVCGFFFREPPVYEPPADLRAFLGDGSAPIYIGFGSIVIEDPEALTNLIIEALRITGVRALISRGWSNLGRGHRSTDEIFYLDDCPHEWLFGRVAAVVHHGGAGTTACGLLNAAPTFIVPFFGDQHFWGSMVASTGAGPLPIPYHSLDVAGFARSIMHCLDPPTRNAARMVAMKIKSESGIKAAVQSFHAHLPSNLHCDVVKEQAAAWLYKDKHCTLKLSKIAAAALLSQSIVKRERFSHMQSKPIHIHVKRWDPVSAVLSAALHTLGSMTRAATEVASEPYEAYKQARSQQLVVDTQPEPPRGEANAASCLRPHSASASDHDHVAASEQMRLQLLQDCGSHRIHDDGEICAERDFSALDSSGHTSGNHMRTARLLFTVSAKSAGRLAFLPLKGLMIDIPLAAAEGMRALPRLYGDDGYEPGAVTNWKNGATIAAKSFTHGVQEGITDVFVKTYMGKKGQGARGVAKGIGEGLLSLTMKTGAAALGLVAYPCQGIYKSVYAAMHTKAREKVDQAKQEEGQWLLENHQNSTSVARDIILGFLQARGSRGE